MGIVASLIVLHLTEVALMAILPLPSQQDSVFFFVIIMVIDAVISVTITKALTGRENTMIAITIYIFGMWLFSPATGFLAIILAFVIWVVSMIVAAA